jgi:hypothetical protein
MGAMTRDRTVIMKFFSPFVLAIALTYLGPVLSSLNPAPRVVALQMANHSEVFKNMMDPVILQ